jgi:hypothetical protein
MSCLFAPRSALVRQESCPPAGVPRRQLPGRPVSCNHGIIMSFALLLGPPIDPSSYKRVTHHRDADLSISLPLFLSALQSRERDKRSLEKRARWAARKREGWKDDESWILLSAFAFCWRNYGRLPACRTPYVLLSLSRRCRPARVRARVVCLPGVEWRGVGVLLYETRGRFPPR